MARGWESKSVESQIDMAEARRSKPARPTAKTADIALVRKREGLLSSRTRVVRELENAQNARYRAVLTKALAELESQIAAIPQTDL